MQHPDKKNLSIRKASELSLCKFHFKLLGALTVVPTLSTWLRYPPLWRCRQGKCSNAALTRGPSRIKDPASTPTCSACFKPGSRKKDTCADLRSHVPESELPNCFAFTSGKHWTRRQFVRSLPSHLKDKPESPVGLKLKEEHG